jgi:hypothetical protein
MPEGPWKMFRKHVLKSVTFATAFMLSGCFVTAPQFAGSNEEDSGAIRYVGARTLNVRICPDIECEVAVKVYRGHMVEVYEAREGWSRISKYYEAKTEGLKASGGEETSGKVARWASSKFLWRHKPGQTPVAPKTEVASASQVTAISNHAPDTMGDASEVASVDHLIKGLPRAGFNNFTRQDVQYLRAYAERTIRSGDCTSVEYADKSVIVEGRYYVHCTGEELHRFFFPEKDKKTASLK